MTYPNTCFNCKSTMDWYLLSKFTTESGATIHLCDDCRAEEVRVEIQAHELASAPIECPERARLVDLAQSSRELLNRLQAHEQTQCAACASTRKTVQDDRLYVDAAAVCCEGMVA